MKDPNYAMRLAARRLRRQDYVIYGGLGLICAAGIGIMITSGLPSGILIFTVGLTLIVICRKIGV